MAEIGLEHEARELARLSKGLTPYDVATDRGVCLIDNPRLYTVALLVESRDQTLAALKAGADLVCQAAFVDGSFHGFCYFLIRDDAYHVCDGKLSRNERPKAQAPVFRQRRRRLLELRHRHQAAESPAE